MALDRVLIFARRPSARAGAGRLSPPLPLGEAAAVYEACLRDVVALAARERARIEIWYEESRRAREYFAAAFPHLPRVRQVPGPLGDRLHDAFAWSFADEAERVLVLGSEAPALPAGVLGAALDALREADVVLGPARAGGHYLVGVRRAAWPKAAELFRGLPWTGPDALRRVYEAAGEAALALRLLPGSYGIEGIEDLLRARQDLPPSSHLGRWLASRAARRFLGA